ncbi:aminotransferase [Solwaraspora sp. WMMB762]|uniref:aminotransferase n=1 Tax=Solwaraspora sp. WMMB762 TaxID=3404120 RepID=UPI003B95D029
MRFNTRVADTVDSPIGSAYEALDQRIGKRDLLDLAQAAPQYPPPPVVAERLASVARDARGAEYTEIAGLPRLREAFAREVSDAYRGRVSPTQVFVTAGCNQAFCLATSALAGPGDEIVLTLPYYFNHDMWLRTQGIAPVYLEPGPDLMPTPEAAEALITPRTRAIVVVSPGNPTGITMPPERIAAIAAVAARHDVALVLDETYRSFRGTTEPAHHLFVDPAWDRTLVSLHSFSKDLAVPGYRVGAVVASPALGAQITKLLDCVAICAPRIGQEAVLTGLVTAGPWRRQRAAEVRRRQEWFAEAMANRPGGFELLSAGGFFGWVRHPFTGRTTAEVVRELIVEYDTLVIPGTAFLPDDRGMLRVSVSNADRSATVEFAGRLAEFGKLSP